MNIDNISGIFDFNKKYKSLSITKLSIILTAAHES
jgi:hypothetical protein